MAELKHTFTSGRMNKDLDERLIPNGEYIDALNIQVSSSEGSDVGAVENVLGNEKISNLRLPNAKTIGAVAYPLKNKLYYFVTSEYVDGIYEYDEKNNTVTPVLIDTKQSKIQNLLDTTINTNIDSELVLEKYNSSVLKSVIGNDLPINNEDEVLVLNNIDLISNDHEILITIPRNTTLKKDTNGNLVFKNIDYSGIKYGNIDFLCSYSGNGILNFSQNNIITGVNIIDDLLFWTDNLNQPRRINISEFKKNTAGIIDKDTQIEYYAKDSITKQITKLTRPFNEDDISVVRKSPMYAPKMDLYTSLSDGVVNIKYTLNLSNVYVGQSITLDSLTEVPAWEVGDFVKLSALDLDFELDANVKSVTDTSVELNIATITGENDNASHEYTIKLKQKKALYELNFARFAYRWKYKNGEYSTISPFTEPAFIPDDFIYDGKEAFNYGMINQLQRVILSEFDSGSDDISEIDILYKEVRNQNIYVLQTVKKLDFSGSFEIKKEQIHSVIPNDQLLRAWDNVPRKAKAQEITANRIIYGNYTQNYDVYNDPLMKVSLTNRDDNFKRTIKSNRTYQVGVAYIDEYNRHTPILSNDTGTKQISKDNSTVRNKFSITLDNKPPAWAKWFKYYIKDTSGEYYNLAADRFYQDVENGFTYISFPSSDRSKITNDHYIILKKKHGADEAVLDKDNRYKIIDIFSDAPEFVTNRKRNVYSLSDVIFTDNISDVNIPGGTTITNREQTGAQNGVPVEDYSTIQIKIANGGHPDSSQSPKQGIAVDDANELKPGRFIQFSYNGKNSDIYEIKSIQNHSSGDNEMKVTVTEPFGNDVNKIYSKTAPYNIGDDNTNLGVSINILETYSAAGDKEFDGRFFVKLKTNGVLSSAVVKEEVGGKSYLAKQAIGLNGVYYDYDRDNQPGGAADRDRSGNGRFDDENRFRKNADTQTNFPFIVSYGGRSSAGNTPETGQRKTFGTLEYNITLEQQTWKNGSEFTSYINQIRPGDFVRFKNQDGTPHHDTIYEIGQVKESTRKQTSWSGKTFFDSDRTMKDFSIRFIDENGEFKPLDQNICVRNQKTTGGEIIMEILQELDEEKIIIKDPAIFETEPLDKKTELDIYYETEKAIPIEEHGQSHSIEWYNAICFGNGVESNRIRDDFNAVFIDTGVRASTVLAEPFKEEHKFNGLIWSGIINSRSGTNQSNQFNMANAITKDLLPSYGSVQKLFARDSDLVIYCEDKIVRALADKDILYNADGSANITASNKVIGNVIPFTGEYGISRIPQSFAYYGFRAYNADPKRGVILRLSQDGLTPISAANMSNFFRDRLFGYDNVFGSYDNRNEVYNISFDDLDTVCFAENVNGWVTRKSFVPEFAISLNNKYYSFLNGEIWLHDSENIPRNNFYNEQYTSTITFDINDDPSVVKKYKTLGYEGSSGWKAIIETDQQKSSKLTFKDKENKYFVNIVGESKTVDNLDTKNMSAQGIGKSVKKTTITGITGDILVGTNGEIIILGGGDGIIGPDYIITGDGIGYDFDGNGNIILTGGGIGGSSGTGGGGGGIGTGGNIIINDENGGGDGFGTGGSGLGVDEESNYTDQLGDTTDTTATFSLTINDPNISVKDKTLTQKPGTAINQVSFTIMPNNGYYLDINNFKASPGDTVDITKSGDNLIAVYSIGITQPTIDLSYNYVMSGKATKNPVDISGTYTVDLQHATTSLSTSGSYVRQGNFGEEKIINERIVTANSGYTLSEANITIDNSLVNLQKVRLSSTAYKLIESIFIPKNKTTNVNYTISVTANEIFVPNPKLISKVISTNGVSNLGEQRTLTIIGEQNSEFELVFKDTSSTIIKQNFKIDFTGQKDILLDFASGNTAETYTIEIKNLTGTDIDTNFGVNTITIVRSAKSRKTASFYVTYSNNINNSFSVSDYIGSSTSRDFSFNLTLPAGTYTIGRQPVVDDINFGNNSNISTVILNNISFDTINTNVLTVSGKLTVGSFVDDETYYLNISSIVGKNTTTTFAYSINASDGNPSGNYTASTTTYTVSGGAGLSSTPSASEYFWSLTPSAGYIFSSTIDADNFEILDSSNQDVSANYINNGELLLRKVGDNIEIGFKTKTFIQPSSSSTFTVRPKPSTTLTEVENVTYVNSYRLRAGLNFFGVTNSSWSSYSDAGKTTVNFDSTTQQLFQIKAPASILKSYYDKGYGAVNTNDLNNTSIYYLDDLSSPEVTLAASGSYTDYNGNSVSVSGPFEWDSTNKELTVNLLVDLNSDTSITLSHVNVYIGLDNRLKYSTTSNTSVDKYYLVSLKMDDCKGQVGGPYENNIAWSPIDENEDVYPKYYCTAPTLAQDERIFMRTKASEPIPGLYINGIITASVIQKNNPNLFSAERRIGFTYPNQDGWLKDNGPCPTITNNIYLYVQDSKTNYVGVPKADVYYDYVLRKIPVYSEIYRDQKVTLTGVIRKYFNTTGTLSGDVGKTNYDIVKAQLAAAGINKNPIDTLDFSDDYNFSKEVYFDAKGNGTIVIGNYRGKATYGYFIYFNNQPDSGAYTDAIKVVEMSRADGATEDTIPPYYTKTYTDNNIIKQYYQGTELERADGGTSRDVTVVSSSTTPVYQDTNPKNIRLAPKLYVHNINVSKTPFYAIATILFRTTNNTFAYFRDNGYLGTGKKIYIKVRNYSHTRQTTRVTSVSTASTSGISSINITGDFIRELPGYLVLEMNEYAEAKATVRLNRTTVSSGGEVIRNTYRLFLSDDEKLNSEALYANGNYRSSYSSVSLDGLNIYLAF